MQLVESQHGLSGLFDGVVDRKDLKALAKNLPRRVRRGVIVLGRRNGITALLFSQRQAVVVSADRADQLAAKVQAALKKLKRVPASGIKLTGVSPGVGVPERAF